jgi:hypothetical protein
MGTGLKVGTIFEDKTQKLYAADSGVEHATYEIVYDNCSQVVSPSAYDEYDFDTTYEYQLTGAVNEEVIDVKLQNLWVPSNISPPSSPKAESIAGSDIFRVKGAYPGEGTYRTRMEWYDDCGLDLKIKHIGIWLSPGFLFVPGSSSLEADPLALYYPKSVDLQKHMGGMVVIFNFSPAVNFLDLPNLGGVGEYHSVYIDIDYVGPAGAEPTCVSWVDTTGISAISFAWDSESKVYHVVSVADDTTIDSMLAAPPYQNLDIFDGALVAERDITLQKDNTVAGDIIHGGSFSAQQGFKHLDGELRNEDPDLPTMDENIDFADGVMKEAVAIDSYIGDYTVSPGNGVDPFNLGPIYISGNLIVEKDNIIVVHGPVYVGGKIETGKNCSLAGSGNLVAEGDIHLHQINGFGTGVGSLIMSLNGNILCEQSVNTESIIYAPQGDITFQQSATVKGSVVAGGHINTNQGSTFMENTGLGDYGELPGAGPGIPKTLSWEID